MHRLRCGHTIGAVIASLVDRAVAVAVAEPADYLAALPAAEAEQISTAVERRQHEFTAGRTCARRALAQLGCADAVLLRAADRGPVWPARFTGSITHTDGFCAAAAARTTDYAGIGIDAERRATIESRVVARFTTPAERDGGLRIDGQAVPLLWFSAKEAFFKAWSAAGGRWIDYSEGEVSVDTETRSFTVAVDGITSGAGRFALTADHVFCAVMLPPR